MHRCFVTVIEPLLEALAPRMIVEVGAGHGRLTARLLQVMRSEEAVVHAIDPRPQPGLLRLARTDARVRLHELPGVEALASLGAADLVLLGGDPNWSTVRAEIESVIERSRDADVAPPVIVVHNVHWPFGRRDGYHVAPDAPAHHPVVDSGLAPGRSQPTDGGLRLTPFVAVGEGGERNGVLTAIDDFIADDPADWELIEIPGYGGTAVLASAARAGRDARLSGVLATLRSSDAMRRAGRRAEAGRIEAEIRAIAAQAGGAEHDELRDTAARLEAQLAAAAESSATELAAAAASSAELRAERDRLRGEALELRRHRAGGEAAQARVERLQADLAEHDRLRAEAAAEHNEQTRAAIDACVRLEYAESDLQSSRAAVDKANAALADQRRAADDLTRRVGELTESERLASGRVLHLQDSLGAAQAELQDAQAQLAELRQSLQHARASDRQAAELVRAARSTRRLRLVFAVRRLLGLQAGGTAARLDHALAVLERDERMRPVAPDAGAASVPSQPSPR